MGKGLNKCAKIYFHIYVGWIWPKIAHEIESPVGM